MVKRLKTVHDVIHALGGHTAASQWAGYDHTSGTANWLSRGIPPAFHVRLLLEMKRRGFDIDPDVFELDDQDASTFRKVFASAQPA